MLSVRKFGPDQFERLRTDWNFLQTGSEMTAFQSFEWFELVNEHFRRERLSRAVVRAVYYLVSDETGAPVLIAPLRVHLLQLSPHHRRGVHLLGRNGYADYLNLVYKEFDPVAATMVIRRAAEDFGIRHFLMERLVEGASSREWFTRQPGAISDEHEAVQLEVPQSEDAYTRRLSKSTRQNIRTAWNRSRKDGLNLRIDWAQAPVEDEAASELALLKHTREVHRARLNRGIVSRLRAATRAVIFSALFARFNEAHEAMKRMADPWVLRVSADGRLCAFAFGLQDHFGGARVLRVLQVGYDEAFARYSPGLLGLHAFISDEAERQRPSFDIVDFTRGGERYKYDLGGTRTSVADVAFTIGDAVRLS